MKFIKYDDFYLPNYQYYELLEKTGRYDNIKIILSTGNELAGKLLDSFKNNAYDQAKKLVEHDLESGYLYNQNFDFDKLEIYYEMRPLYDDYSYVDDTEYYIELLKNRGLSDKLIRSFFTDACNNYSRYGLTTLMTQANNHEIFLIADPSSKLTTLNDTSYIGAYVPHNLVLMSDIHRLKYAMYLESDAYEALKKMVEAMPDDIAEDFYVKEAYESFNDFQYSNPALPAKMKDSWVEQCLLLLNPLPIRHLKHLPCHNGLKHILMNMASYCVIQSVWLLLQIMSMILIIIAM